MINVKDEVFAAIKDISENVSDSYPKDWSSFPAIQYVEEDNKVAEYTDAKEQKAYVRYKIDIWHNRSTSVTALAVDAAIAPLGLRRIQCTDVDDPTGHKHKMMRYEGIIDVETKQVYQNN
jgi:hypothetical protein